MFCFCNNTFSKIQFYLLLGSGQIEFEEFTILAAKFIIEEDDEDVQKELKEAFRLYDRDG
jgi:Ca2+-binding EF-hand superfamily protein